MEITDNTKITDYFPAHIQRDAADKFNMIMAFIFCTTIDIIIFHINIPLVLVSYMFMFEMSNRPSLGKAALF